MPCMSNWNVSEAWSIYGETLVVVDLRGLIGVISDDAEPELVGVDVIDVFRGRVDVVVRAGAIEDHAVENADGMSELRIDGYGLDRSTRFDRAEVESLVRGRTALENGEVEFPLPSTVNLKKASPVASVPL